MEIQLWPSKYNPSWHLEQLFAEFVQTLQLELQDSQVKMLE